MTIAFISDLHLDPAHPQIVDIFLQFLTKNEHKISSLYILGDFFEIWIGDDDLTPFNIRIIQALRQAKEQGLALYFMPGNRDFLIGKKFLKMSGCQLLPDEYVIDLYGTPTLLMHGDTLCTRDEAYLKFRKKARNRFFQTLFLLKSLKKRQALAARYRAASQLHTRTAPVDIMDVTEEEVQRVMLKHGVQQLIHGHTHRPAFHTLQLNHQSGTRIVLGAWHEEGNALLCTKDHKPAWITLT